MIDTYNFRYNSSVEAESFKMMYLELSETYFNKRFTIYDLPTLFTGECKLCVKIAQMASRTYSYVSQ